MESLENEFSQKIMDIFGHNLVFGFICGSLASGLTKSSSDIDILVCVGDINLEQKKRFDDLYLKLHERYSHLPDLLYPGELMTKDQLDQALRRIRGVTPSAVLHEKIVYDGIVWSGMLSDQVIGLVGDTGQFKVYQELAKILVKNWVMKLAPKESNTVSNHGKILKKLIIYENEDKHF